MSAKYCLQKGGSFSWEDSPSEARSSVPTGCCLLDDIEDRDSDQHLCVSLVAFVRVKGKVFAVVCIKPPKTGPFPPLTVS